MISVHVSDHALERFHERVRPALTREQAAAEFDRLLVLADIRPGDEIPEWVYAENCAPCEAVAFITDTIVVPLKRHGSTYFAVSCLTRGGLGEGARAARNHQRRGRQRKRHAQREKWRERKARKMLDKGHREHFVPE